ncbi:uncharacterized protein N0V96_011442 [Colletotrichum fioriniae]|uniref:uncharacterized protein n=1 Tax=Colletotrichum fioriniae TaxID=710243 RepID=UPI0032D9FDA2|nr:hypothetical protein N0V96_011442 [Colletotrichum fioriniae]
MAVDVEELILAPFREVVERGEESAKNAHDAQDDDPETSREMAKSASIIAKEGQRALKRLQPLWNSQFEKHGDVFKDTIAENEGEDRRQNSDHAGAQVSAIAASTAITTAAGSVTKRQPANPAVAFASWKPRSRQHFIISCRPAAT